MLVVTQDGDDADRPRIDGSSGGAGGGGAGQGFLCVSLLRADGRILGATAVGAGAAEVVAEFSLAMSAGLTIADVALALQPYPSHATALGVLARAAAADSLLEVGRGGGPLSPACRDPSAARPPTAPPCLRAYTAVPCGPPGAVALQRKVKGGGQGRRHRHVCAGKGRRQRWHRAATHGLTGLLQIA